MSQIQFSSPIYSDQIQNIQALLMKLHGLEGLVYLHNQGEFIIGFLPHTCWTIQNQTIYRSVRLNFNQYQKSIIKNLDELKNQFHLNNKNLESQFTGGIMGFVSYDYAVTQHVELRQMQQQPSAYFGLYLSYLKYQHGQWFFYSQEKNAQSLFDEIQQRLQQTSSNTTSKFSLNTPCHARWTLQNYQHAFQKVQDYIVAGDCYQINLTQEFNAEAEGLLLEVADQFWQLTNAPYAGYFACNDFELLSCSPELFIEFESERKIVTKPIKGTMPRHSDPVLDQASKDTLSHSKKDQAENVMIVDLLRNDLSIYAEIGSVKTPKLFEIESFNQVHHMVSEVTATLKESIHPFDVLMATLPGGSITGAPKIRAMQIIDELEQAPRGAYCGSLGYFNLNGTGSWNILIRSLQKYQNNVSLWAGGGVTIASDCDAEYQECFDKVSAMLDLLNTCYQPK